MTEFTQNSNNILNLSENAKSLRTQKLFSIGYVKYV